MDYSQMMASVHFVILFVLFRSSSVTFATPSHAGLTGVITGGTTQLRYNNTAEYDLRQFLMSNYRLVRPVQKASDSLLVMSRLFPIKIQELVEKEERLVLTVRVQLGWVDQTMAWDPDTFYNQTSVVLPYDVKIWLPELQIVNSALDMYGIFSIRDRRSPVKAHSNGEVWWHPTGRMDVRCELQLMYFPFDFQRCGIIFEPVIYTQEQLNLTLRPDRSAVALSMYSENGLWDLVKTGGRHEVYWVSSTTGFSRVEFVLYLQRRTTYYKMNIIFPCLLLSVLQLLTFILPIDNDERVPQATTILLSVIVFQTVIVDQLPKSSTSMSLLAMYISTLVGISTATVASSIICSLFISLRPSCFQIPPLLEPLVRQCVTRLPPDQPGEQEQMPLQFAKGSQRQRRSVFTRTDSTQSPPSAGFDNNSANCAPKLTNHINSVNNSGNTTAALMHQHANLMETANVDENIWQHQPLCQHHMKVTQQQLQPQLNRQQLDAEPSLENQSPRHAPSLKQQINAKLTSAGVFTFHERSEYGGGFRYPPPTTSSSHRRQRRLEKTLCNSLSNNNVTSPSLLLAASSTPKMMSAAINNIRRQSTQQSPSLQNQQPKPPYVLVIDWCRMSHIINAAMFTLCLCLDVLVPSVLFYVMPPVNPPVD